MKKYEKEVIQAELDNEKQVLKNLEKEYKKALAEINEKIEVLLARSDADMAHVIYQTQYQQALKGQIEGILKNLQSNEFETISEYLTASYEDGFIGTLYALQKQGVPFAFPVRQELVVSAIQHETKLSSGLYKELGIDMTKLKNDIASEISRGIVTNVGYQIIARNVSNKAKIPLNRSMTIARTESHRIIESAQHHVQEQAVAKGADVVKIWDATLDRKTRRSHMELDGQIRDVDKPFTIAGKSAMYPGDFGEPEEDINCRCRSRCEAKWALDSDDTKSLGNVSTMTDKRKKEIADKLGVPVDDLQEYSKSIVPIRAKSYDDFKDQYSKLWKYDEKGNAERVRGSVQKINSLENTGKSGIIESDIIIFKSVGAKSKNYDIKLPDGEMTRLTEGTRVTNIETIAGKGRNREIDIVDLLIDAHGGKESEWQKKKGFGYVDYQGESYRAELHWYEEPTAGRHEWKIKPDADGNWFYDEDK